jgi:hypothetical protein
MLALMTAVAAAAATPAMAQQDAGRGGLEISGSLRLRYEAIEGQPRAGFNASDDLLNTRLRVLTTYDAGLLRFGAEIYDSRVFSYADGTPVTTGEVNAFEPVQAYVAADWRPAEDVRASVQLGRFTLNLGSRRLVAADDYRNTTNGYTGARLDLRGQGGSEATFIYVLPQVRLPNDISALEQGEIALDRESDDLVLFGGVATLPLSDSDVSLQASYFGLRESDRPDTATRDRRLDTWGLRAFRAPNDAWDFDLETMAQTGSISASSAVDAAELDVEAYFVHAELGWRFAGSSRPRIAVLYDYASGDEPGGAYERFDTLFGMRRAELAPAGLYNAVGRANLSSFGLRFEITPSPRWDAFASLRSLRLASDTDAFSTSGVRDPAGTSGGDAGVQLDGRVRYWLVPERVRLELNAVYLDKGPFLRDAPNISSREDTTYLAFDLTYAF